MHKIRYYSYTLSLWVIKTKYTDKKTEKIMDWIMNNKEWLFSGLGIAIFGFILNFFRKKNTPVKIENNNFLTIQDQNSQDKNSPKKKTKAEIQTLFIDDEKFDIVDILKKAEFPNTKTIKDILNLDSSIIKNADVIFVDVNGVGCKLFPTDQGLGLAEAIKTRNPEKFVVIYSAQEQRLHKAFSVVDAVLQKNAEPYEFINLLENFLRK